MPKRPRIVVRRSANHPLDVAVSDGTVNEQLVEEATAWIRTKLAKTLFKGMSEIGEYVLEKFFDGDPERVRSKDPTKNASFRSLVERCESTDLPIGRAALQRAVSVAVLLRALPRGATAYPQLPPTHQATLLPLREEPETVEILAERALALKFSVRDLREEVTHAVMQIPPDGPRRGRRPTPDIVKALARSLRLLTLEGGRRSFTNAQLDELSGVQVKEAIKSAEEIVARMQRLIEKLGAR